MLEFTPILLALLGGILPALAWLWFWLREDSAHPEPRQMIALAFFVGMIMVVLVIPVQKFFAGFLATGMILFAVWSFIEEIMKYLGARFTVLKSMEVDEPIDMVIYMVTIALGFAALENALFLLKPLSEGLVMESVLTGNLRFIGATLLHVVSSAVVGIALALAFYKPRNVQRVYAFAGILLAALLHTGFNFLILSTKDEHLFRVFAAVWLGVVVVLALLEIVKRIKTA